MTTTSKFPFLLPNTVNEITSEWISHILNIEIIPQSFQLESNAYENTGFLSSMARIKFKTRNKDFGNGNNYSADTIREYFLIAKLLPEESNSLELILADHFDQAEIYTYQILLPELLKQVPELKEYICPFIFGAIQESNNITKNIIPYSSILILQDLKVEGYIMKKFNEDFGTIIDNNNSLPLPYFIKGLDFLVKFHAAAKSLEFNNQKTLPELFTWLPKIMEPLKSTGRKIPIIHTWFPNGLIYALEFLSEYTNSNSNNTNSTIITMEMIKKFTEISKHANEILQIVLKAGHQYATILHGDLWPHNILIQPETNDIKVIDWQMLSYSDPAFELGIYITQALDINYLTKENILNSCKLYYNNYQEYCTTKLNVPCKRNSKEFEVFFQTYGLAYAFIWLVLGVQDMVAILEYRPKVYRIFELVYKDFGVLDFLLSLV